MIKKLPLVLVAFWAISLAPLIAGQEDDPTLRLALGDQKYKDKTIEVRPGEVVSARRGRPVSAEDVFRDLRRADFIYIGETHNSLPMHDIQLQVLRAVHDPGGRKLALGVEMFPVTSQEVLDTYIQSRLGEEEFLRRARWYVVWNYAWGFYSKIFTFAQQNAIPIRALNAPRETITRVRMNGWESLSDEEKKLVPNPDLSLADHRTLMRAIFSSEEMPHQMKGAGFEAVFEGLYRAQAAWDEVMAANAIQAAGQGDKRVVVLAGAGHLLYNLGINRRVYDKNHRTFRTIVCVVVPKGRTSLTVSRSLADYVWGLPEEDRPAYPSVGLRLKTFAGLSNPVLEDKPIEGVAVGQDFDKGDVVLSVDGRSFSDVNDLRMHLARFTWGEEATFRLLRAGQEKTVVLKFAPPIAEPAPQNKNDLE